MKAHRDHGTRKGGFDDPVGNAVPEDHAAKPSEMPADKDRLLRLAADFDNFRRRTSQETEQRAAAQKESFIQELLPAIDNLERALASNNGSTSHEKLRQGVQMTLHQLLQILRRHGIEPESSLGQVFDPDWQEAVSTRRDPGRPDHTVLEVFQRGYRRGREVFRPAKVIVNDLNQPASNTASAQQPSSESGRKRATDASDH
jgi:molecular chaperone GrpE (heat shock protein)